MPTKTNKVIVYLIKPQYIKAEDIIDSTQEGIAIPDVGTFYFEESGIGTPSWLADFFGATLDQDLKILAASARGVLLVPITHENAVVHFVVSFGLGRHLIKPGVIEDRFGLRVVLNSVDPKSLRSIDKTTLGSTPRHTREQIGRDSIAADFGLDIEQDLVSSVTGKSRHVQQLGKTITGKDSLAVSAKVDATNINGFLSFCYQQYLSEEYKKEFEWIDQIADVRDPLKIEELNNILLERLKNNQFDRIWMAVPEVIDWVDIKGFRYLRAKEAALKDDLDIKDFLEALKDKQLDVDVLKRSRIFVVSAKTGQADDYWPAYQCVYAEVEHDGLVYVLNNGKWYRVMKNFAEQINAGFAQMEQSTVTLLEYAHADEGAYNKAAASGLQGSCCMDRELIIHGGGHSSIEFCDIYEKDAKRLIHVKPYGGSSHLSHLFSQGAVAGELFVADQEFREKLNDKLPTGYKLQDPQARPNPGEYEVVYGVISNSQKPLDIPFFSKVSLRNAKRRLRGYGFNKVTIKKISHAAGGSETQA
jgi:uncharacterized protein (TIGR04141 family)